MKKKHEPIWTFDDIWFGKSANGNRTVTERLLRKPAGVPMSEWYTFASQLRIMILNMRDEYEKELSMSHKLSPNTDKITNEELQQWFGDTIPIEVITYIFNAPLSTTVGEVRRWVRNFAEQSKRSEAKNLITRLYKAAKDKSNKSGDEFYIEFTPESTDEWKAADLLTELLDIKDKDV